MLEDNLGYLVNDLVRTEVRYVPIGHSKRAMSQLALDIAKVCAGISEFKGASVSQTVYVCSFGPPGTFSVRFEHTPYVRITESVTVDGVKIVSTVLASFMPGLYKTLESLLRNRGHATFASLAAANGNGAAEKLDISVDEIESFIATELGIDVDGD